MPNPTDLASHPYASFLHLVERPARYLGGEWGMIRKPWDTTRVRICLAFPDIYDVGMSHLGTRILYNLLNTPSDMLCERAFSPWLDMEEQLRAHNAPLISLENHKSLRDFHVVGISLQHELVYTNVLTLLDLGGIPLRADQRSDTDPLVLGGGSIATHPEPIAPFFDALVVGDGEARAQQVARSWVEDLEKGVPRQQRLVHLASLGGVYVPSLYERHLDNAARRVVVTRPTHQDAPLPVQRAVVQDLDEFPFPAVFPTGGPEAVFDRFSIELARGCSQGCRFCQAGMIFRPERERSPKAVLQSIDDAITKTGQDEFSLTSLSPADYSAIGPLVHEASAHVHDKHVTMNVSSLRAYGLGDGILEEIRQVRASNLTFAPEAGTQRLRDVINKNVTEEQVLDTVQRVVRLGWSRIKLYFMIGLPTETQQDVEGILQLASKAQRVARQGKGKARATRVTSSASTFVPKPHTPFQWSRMITLEEVQDKHRLMRSRAKQFRVDIKMHESHGSVLEGVLSRGDTRLADVIETAWQQGARFDAWDGHVDWDMWTEAFAEHGLEPEPLLEAFPEDAPLPWDHIDPGVDRAFLLREWKKAQAGKLSQPCLRPSDYVEDPETEQISASPDDKLVCLGCGLSCDMKGAAQKRAAVAHQLGTKPQVAQVQPRAVTIQDAGREQATTEQAPTALPQIVTYRFNYAKTNSATFWGHLDLVREMPRVFRRAGLHLAYSQGFHPKPIMTFGPALKLGVPGLDEYVDVRVVTDDMREDDGALLDRLNGAAPEGVRFHRIHRFDQVVASVGKRIAEGTLLLGLPEQRVAEAGGQAWLRERIESVMASDELVVKRKGKRGRIRDLNVRPYLMSIQLDGDSGVFADTGIVGGWTVLKLVIRQEQSGSARLGEVVRVLVGQTDGEAWEHRAVRVALRGPDGADVLGEG